MDILIQLTKAEVERYTYLCTYTTGDTFQLLPITMTKDDKNGISYIINIQA